MTVEEAKEYAKDMSYTAAVYNAMQGRAVPFRKATAIKLKELLEIAKRADEDTQNQVEASAVSFIPEACKRCTNHPSNGGSGICHCTLGVITTW